MRLIKDLVVGALIGVILGILVFLVIVYFNPVYGQEPQTNRWRGVPSHDVPHCSPAPHDLTKTASCACIGMVNNIRTVYAKRCFVLAGMEEGEINMLKLGQLIGLALPPQLSECLAAQPDHCNVLSRTWQWQQELTVPYNSKSRCSTACKPERCGCADGPCKAHEEEGDYQ